MRSLLLSSVLLQVATLAAAIHTSPHEAAPFTHTLEGNRPVGVNPDNSRLVDGFGREVYFHGVNVVVKNFPYLPNTQEWSIDDSFCEKDMAAMEELGLNSIRLGAMWIGIEPQRDVYNETYLNNLVNITRWAGEDFGVYSLWDSHQDIVGPKYLGDGFPLWTVSAEEDLVHTFPEPFSPPYKLDNKTSIPLGCNFPNPAIKSWVEYYFTFAAASAGGRFWDNYDGWRDKWNLMWQKLASLGRGLGSSLLGYELINEPFPGNIWHNLSLALPTMADAYHFQPAYDKVASEFIFPTDPDHAIFFEGVTWDEFATGFHHVPGGDQFKNRSILSYHFYEVDIFGAEFMFKARRGDLDRLQCGGFLTEFALYQEAPTHVMDVCDQFAQSWMGWIYKGFAMSGNDHRDAKSKVMSADQKKDLQVGTCQTSVAKEQSSSSLKTPKGKIGEILEKYVLKKTRRSSTASSPSYSEASSSSSGDFSIGNGTFWFPNGTINPVPAKMIARTFARVVAGSVILTHFNTTTSEYNLKWNVTSDFFDVATNTSYAVTKIYASEEYNYCNKPAVSSVAVMRGGQSVPSSGVTVSRVKRNHYFYSLDFTGGAVQIGDVIHVQMTADC